MEICIVTTSGPIDEALDIRHLSSRLLRQVLSQTIAPLLNATLGRSYWPSPTAPGAPPHLKTRTPG